MRPKYYYQVFLKTVTLEKLRCSALNRGSSPLLIGMFFELGILVVWLFILAESLQVKEKQPIFFTAKVLRTCYVLEKQTNSPLVTSIVSSNLYIIRMASLAYKNKIM